MLKNVIIIRYFMSFQFFFYGLRDLCDGTLRSLRLNELWSARKIWKKVKKPYTKIRKKKHH